MIDPQVRKSKSISILKDLGIPVLDSLPAIKSSDETTLRKAEEVARRALCLVLISDLATGSSGDACRQYIKKNNLYSDLSPAERRFFDGKDSQEKASINLSWRREAAYLLFWALRLEKTLPIPREETATKNIYAHLPRFDANPTDWIKQSKLIEKEKILDQSDLLYRMHWATRQARFNGTKQQTLNASVVQEWHHAINWLTCYEGEAWDDVPTDT